MTFEGDALLEMTNDGGSLVFENDLIKMSGGLENAVTFSLFGGNTDDNGKTSDSKKTWWGNEVADKPDEKLVSRTANFITEPLTPSEIPDKENLVLQDLQWIKTQEIADEINVSISLPSVGYTKIDIQFLKDQKVFAEFSFSENWGALQNG